MPRQGRPPTSRGARRVVFFIADGMGPAHRTAARLVRGTPLAMERLPVAGLVHTASANSVITDSAASATAYACGVKTNNGMVGVDAAGRPVPTILEQAQRRGLAVGLVTTTQVTHATVAAFASHVGDRQDMEAIALQYLEGGLDVVLGGGEDWFIPQEQLGRHRLPGHRTDGKDLIRKASLMGYTCVGDGEALQALDGRQVRRLLGLFSDEGMVRPFLPTLAEMTAKALQVVAQNPRGFFLVVEGGQIDWASHDNDAVNAIGDTLGFDEAVAVGLAFAREHPETLLVVTSDHETGGLVVCPPSSDDAPEFATPDGRPFAVAWTLKGHSAVDIPIAAQGPGAELLAGALDNTRVYHALRAALLE